MSYYLDTSAILKLYKMEAGTKELVAFVRKQKSPIPLSPFHELEFVNAVELNVHWKHFTRTQADAVLAHFRSDGASGVYDRLTVDLAAVLLESRRLSVAYTAAIGARSLDILHVATAREIGASLFVSGDGKQLALAKKAGLKCLSVAGGR
jgi:predicted nucleic acid-binding protein